MNLSELLKKIEDETRNLPTDPGALSDLLVRLASYYSTLSPFVASAWKDAEDAKTGLKIQQEQIKIRAINQDSTAAAAESKKLVDTAEQAKAVNEKLYKYKLLQFARENLETTIDAIRSKLTTARHEQETSHYAT